MASKQEWLDWSDINIEWAKEYLKKAREDKKLIKKLPDDENVDEDPRGPSTKDSGGDTPPPPKWP